MTEMRLNSQREGSALAIVLVVMVALTFLVLSLFQDGYHSARETDYELKSAQAFWLAEAGRQACVSELFAGGDGIIAETAVAGQLPGSFIVIEDPADSGSRICTGIVAVGGQIVSRRIRVQLAFVAKPFEKAVYAGNGNNLPWSFQMRGTGSTDPNSNGSGGIDRILGDLDINGNVLMQGASRVDLPTPNRYGALGNVDASGSIDLQESAGIAGIATPWAGSDPPPDLSVMDYANNNNYDVAKIFNDAGVTSGYLPSDHPLYGILNVVKNPSNRSAENASTPGDDFYFEPRTIDSGGTATSGGATLNLGDDKVYYVEGHVWFHSKSTYGFVVDGQAAIVSSADIHISDNLIYADRGLDGDLLALVALGQYNDADEYVGDGNIYFGDPAYGTLYTADAFMFANNNFYYNTDSTSAEQREPESGFKVFGNFMAVNQVVVLRDWYTKAGSSRAAEYDPATGEWVDAADARTGTRTVLTETEKGTLRHYAMQVGYDDRIRDAATQMSGLPRGTGKIFTGVIGWNELVAQ